MKVIAPCAPVGLRTKLALGVIMLPVPGYGGEGEEEEGKSFWQRAAFGKQLSLSLPPSHTSPRAKFCKPPLIENLSAAVLRVQHTECDDAGER